MIATYTRRGAGAAEGNRTIGVAPIGLRTRRAAFATGAIEGTTANTDLLITTVEIRIDAVLAGVVRRAEFSSGMARTMIVISAFSALRVSCAVNAVRCSTIANPEVSAATLETRTGVGIVIALHSDVTGFTILQGKRRIASRDILTI